MRSIKFLTTAALAASIFLGQAAAEHEADHRYVVRGFVLDAKEEPISDVGVSVWLGERSVARGRTDSQGYYSARAHLHDEDIGKPLSVRAGDRTATVQMTAQRGDRKSAREHQVNFVGDEVVEGDLAGLRFPAWVYVVTAAASALIVAGFLAHRVSRARRRARSQAAAQAKAKTRERPAGGRRKKRRK